jgi:hypothetical protein
MVIKKNSPSYDFAELYEVESEGVSPVNVMGIQVGDILESVLVRIKTPAVLTEAVTVSIGDNDAAAGFVAAASAKAVAGTVYGQDPTERGAYLYDATKKGGFVKLYDTEKTLKLVLSAAPDTEGIYQVIVKGHRANLN